MGINPLTNKLPEGLQEKWRSRAHKYKLANNGSFPSFAYFSKFVRDMGAVGYLSDGFPVNHISEQYYIIIFSSNFSTTFMNSTVAFNCSIINSICLNTEREL